MFRHVFGNNKIIRKLSLAILLSVFFSIITVISVFFIIERQITTYFLKTFETKSLSQLEMYHAGKVQNVEDLFHHIISITEGLAHEQSIISDLKNGNLVRVKDLLQRQRNINQNLESWYIFDRSGKLIVISSNNTELESSVGKNFGFREYFQAVIKTKKLYVSQQQSGVVTRRSFISFSAPILDERGEVLFVLTGSTTVQPLTKSLELKSHFSYSYNILVDWDYNVIYKDGEFVVPSVNIKNKDQIISRLAGSNLRLINEEINYLGERVIAIGNRIQFASNKESTYYLVSYVHKSKFDNQEIGLKKEIKRLFVGVSILVIFVVILTWCVNIWLINLFITNKRITTEWKKIIGRILP